MSRTLNLVNERIRAIWTLLRWEGEIRNSRVRQLFDLQSVQSSRLIAQFVAGHPQAVRHSLAKKAWICADPKHAVREGGDFAEYLALHSARGKSIPDWFADARLDMAMPSTPILGSLISAARDSLGIEMVYASMTTPAGRARVIFPHAIVRLEQRWHVRAWCAEHEEFRDFNVGRIQKANLIGKPSPVKASRDALWNKEIVVRVIAHQGLTAEHQEMIRQEYFAGTSAYRLHARAALLPYLLKTARVAVWPEQELPPEYLLQVATPESIRPLLFDAPTPIRIKRALRRD